MSNSRPLTLEQFLSECDRIHLCPYCMNPVSKEPDEACCGEVHSESGYAHEDVQFYFIESDTTEAFNAWLAKRKEEGL